MDHQLFQLFLPWRKDPHYEHRIHAYFTSVVLSLLSFADGDSDCAKSWSENSVRVRGRSIHNASRWRNKLQSEGSVPFENH
ncbi:hypothetical protein RvY_11233-3 [Ramazzottius varieornatus]|uniref:Uncharacterized protein n=1 Tax=Ramazzottius varieornatus TaxID=947166 RepID=A0A1D1VN72_RAMVA|nr:hypothetical protein RvY_11233-3 [Ramazzottius varieornatus]